MIPGFWARVARIWEPKNFFEILANPALHAPEAMLKPSRLGEQSSIYANMRKGRSLPAAKDRERNEKVFFL